MLGICNLINMIVEDTVDFHLRSTLFAMRRMYNLIAQENGITQGIGYALINVGAEGMPATKIGPLMGMTSSSLSRMLKKMEDDKMIYRKPDKEDKRIVRIHANIINHYRRNRSTNQKSHWKPNI